MNVDSTTKVVASIATDEVTLSNGAPGLVDEGAFPDNDGGVKDTHEASDVEIANADDGNTVPTSTPGTSVSSIQRPSISEEDITRLQEIVDLVIDIGNNVSQAQDGDDEEEGAIEVSHPHMHQWLTSFRRTMCRLNACQTWSLTVTLSIC